MQFMIIASAAGVAGALLLNGWMTVQLQRHLRRVEQQLAILEHEHERVSGVTWPGPAAASHGSKETSPLESHVAVHRRKRTGTLGDSSLAGLRHREADRLPARPYDAVNAETAEGYA